MSPQSRNDDILDFAILWLPLGGPTSATIWSMFRMSAFEYRLSLADALRFHQDRLTDGRRNLDRVYGASILSQLADDLTNSTRRAA
ncbi:hypothetical protein ACFWAY_36865 [Rhodococcus sp. NPDC059968]|uniref:hypothetical protein n=1 Tax=Rhodococcus sp. NPDC059968 TaxID=3347017 RepID=UPI003670FEEB